MYKLPLPIYETQKESGLAHEPRFRSMCLVKARDELEKLDFQVWGELCKTKKCAQSSTAEKMLQEIATTESELKTSHILEKLNHGEDIYVFLNDTDQHEEGPLKTFFFWDVENYKLTEKLQEFEPYIIFAFDSEGSDSSSSLKIGLQILTDEKSRLIQVTSPTRLQDGADVAIIWMISRSEWHGNYLQNTDCVILSHDKLFCTVKDICDSWTHGFRSVTVMT